MPRQYASGIRPATAICSRCFSSRAFRRCSAIGSGTGFGANEPISIWLNAPDGRVLAAEIEGIAETAPDGRVGFTWVAPKDAPLGAWQMVAHGRESGIEAVAGFTLR